MRGEIDAEHEALNAVRGYVEYMHATDTDPLPDADAPGNEDEVIADLIDHQVNDPADSDESGAFVDPVPALVAEIRRLLSTRGTGLLGPPAGP
jgi:hypothetical protein